jgi:hypothetical protein
VSSPHPYVISTTRYTASHPSVLHPILLPLLLFPPCPLRPRTALGYIFRLIYLFCFTHVRSLDLAALEACSDCASTHQLAAQSYPGSAYRADAWRLAESVSSHELVGIRRGENGENLQSTSSHTLQYTKHGRSDLPCALPHACQSG